jgi:hypothetical protein
MRTIVTVMPPIRLRGIRDMLRPIAMQPATLGCRVNFATFHLPTRQMSSLGRVLQMFGLVILPLASLMQLSGSISVGTMLQMLAAGVCAFGIGWILTTYR